MITLETESFWWANWTKDMTSTGYSKGNEYFGLSFTTVYLPTRCNREHIWWARRMAQLRTLSCKE